MTIEGLSSPFGSNDRALGVVGNESTRFGYASKKVAAAGRSIGRDSDRECRNTDASKLSTTQMKADSL